MSVKFSNNGKTTLSAGIALSDTSIPVSDATAFPSISSSDYFYVTLQDTAGNLEIVKVTGVSSNTLTAIRAQEGTTARAFSSGDKAENRLTAAGLDEISTSTDLNLNTMTGDGSTTTLTLSIDPTTEDNTQVFIDGVYQTKTTYSVTGTTLTFSTAPPNGAAVEVIVITPASGLTSSFSNLATAAQGTLAENALPKSGGAMTGAITTNSTFDGRDVATDGAKLDGIEAGATADQTAAEIKTAYESNADTNAFTDTEKTKLSGIETSATADQTDAEIETAYNNQVGQVSSSERTAGTETAIRRFAPADVVSMVDQHIDSAGAVMNADASTAAMQFVLDEDDFASNSATKVPTQQSVKAYIAAYLDRVGTYIWADTQPDYTLPCNGNAYNRSDYAALFAKCGPSGSNTLGLGNGSTTFNTMDPRGRVPRVTDDGKGIDPDASSRTPMFYDALSSQSSASGDAPGSIQGDRNASHHHFAFHDSGATTNSTALSSTTAAHDFHALTYSEGIYRYEILGTTSQANVGKTSTEGGTDARMKNFGLRLWVYYA